MIKYCTKCYETKNKLCPSGYKWGLKDEVEFCPLCDGELMNIDFSALDLKVIEQISEDKSFIEAMIDLKEKDIIEYNLKLSQFKASIEVQNHTKEQNDNTIKCPTCSSVNISKITNTKKAVKIGLFGIFGAIDDAGKTWKCNSCGSKW